MPRLSLHRLLVGGAALLVFGQIVALLPSSLVPEQPEPKGPEETAVPSTSKKAFAGFSAPAGESADYSIDHFRYVSVKAGKRQWQLTASSAVFYSHSQTVLTREIEARLFSSADRDPKSAGVRVHGREARYSPVTRILEVGGDVVAELQDGSTLHSDFLKFDPANNRVIIPAAQPVFGTGPAHFGSPIQFKCNGLQGDISTGEFKLASQVEIQVGADSKFADRRQDHPVEFRAPKATLYTHEKLLRLESTLPQFTSFFQRSKTGAELLAKSRKMEVQLQRDDGKKTSFVATEDVKIEEWSSRSRLGKPYRYATAGRADYDPESMLFTLTEYPQLYQGVNGEDTMTGEVIRIDRKQDRVEVDHPNAFTRGEHE